MVTTNGSRSLKYLIDLSNYAEIVFSVHMHVLQITNWFNFENKTFIRFFFLKYKYVLTL